MTQSLTVFYADDDIDDLDFFKDIVRGIEGVELFTHQRGNDLIDALHNPPPAPQLIFLDLNMPGKNGFEVLTELKKSDRFREIPVVIFSTSNDQISIAKSMELGASFYLPKLENYDCYKKSIQHTLAIDWQNFKPTVQNFRYSAA